MEEDRARDIVGDIGYDRVILIAWPICEDILVVEREVWGIEFSLEYLYHICIKLHEIEARGIGLQDIIRESAISWSDFDDMVSSNFQ